MQIDTKKLSPEKARILEAVRSELEEPIGEFHWYQLFTHAFLHAGILHLAGNMLFLLVFGTRVNALIGNIAMAIVYPILAAIAGIAFYLSAMHSFPRPMLG